MCAFSKYDAIIVDPDLDTRMRLKQATTAVSNFGKVWQVGSLREGISKLSSPERLDVVFLSYYRFSKEEVIEFISSGKKTQQGQDAAYILVLKGKDQESGTIAQNVMIGADGFLFEPYSVDSLYEITILADKVRKERSMLRESAALRFLISDMMNQIDLVAYVKASGMEVGRGMRKLKELCSVLTTLQPESLELYHKLALDLFENAPLPRKAPPKRYSGASSRVKKKLDDKMLEELEAEFTGKTPEPS